MRLSDIEVYIKMSKRFRKYIARSRNGKTLQAEKREWWNAFIVITK